jgi:DNA-binding transcriptional ArsR family regulator
VAHPLRLRIIAALADRDQTVNELSGLLDTTQPMISQQLRILRMSRLVDVTREASFARYRLIEPALRGLLECIRRCSTHGADRGQGWR